MASTFTDLGLEIMATGENAGTWGDKTNTNLNIVNTAIAGYVEQSIAGGAATTTLTITDGAATSVAQNAVIKLTGSITGNQIVTIPNSIEKVYIITNGTSGAFTVQVKTVSGSGVTFGVSEKTTKLLYSDGTNIVDAGFSGGLDIEGRELVLDADGDTSLTADTDDQIDIKIAGADDFRFTANTFTALSGSGVVIPDSGLTLGSTAVTATAAEINILDGVTGLVAADLTKLAAVDSTAAELNIVDGGTSATSTTVADADRVVLNDNGTMVQVAVTDLAAYFDDEITAMPNLTSVGTLTTLTVDSIIINGTNIGHTSDADALAIDSSGNVTASQNLIVTGDLTVSGDDITMATNTAGNLLIADGTNFNSVAVSSLSEISTAASGDLLLAVDASGGGLKKITRSAVIAGTGSSGDLANVVEDTSPQLGGNLDMNGADIVTTSNATIDLAPNGTGTVVVRGNTNSGAIVFNCESNSHGQKVIAQPHSASVTNTMLLPDGANSTLVSLVATQTLTNKTLTSPKINEDVAVTSTATELNLLDGVSGLVQADLTKLAAVDSTAAELNALDGITAVVGELNALDIGSTAVGTAVASKAVILDSNKDYTGLRNFTVSGELDAATGDFSGNVDVDGTLEADAITINGTAIASVLSPVAGGSSIVTTGALGSGSIAAGFGAIDNGTSGIRSNTITAETAFVPDASGGADLGTTALEFNDAFFNDGAVINFGNDQDTTLTHTDGTGLTLNSTNKLCFNDATQFIQGVSGTVLDIAATDEIELTATLIDVVGNLAASGTLAQAGVATFALAANVAQVAITSSSNAVAWDASAAANAYHITTENTTFSAPSNNVEGAFIVLEINYNGSHTIAFNTIFEFAASTAPTTTDTDGKTDILVFRFNGAVWQEVGRTLNLSES